ncbi:DUF6635 family protein [uncultured Paracoccus sp.]|uniref:DUF6635 family protein n=1 Tax=uncultured Paracoccus sp. TaxID=189685 RepID=UPI002630D46A|nr:DUF6635 family protein [uncultured Paracoccus sp.]
MNVTAIVPSYGSASAAGEASTSSASEYFDGCRARIDGFVDLHFTWRGTLRLHGAAFGWDLLRAPLNVALAPVLVLTRIAALAFRRLGLRHSGDWLARRRILLRTSVAERIEALVASQLLALPRVAGDSDRSSGRLPTVSHGPGTSLRGARAPEPNVSDQKIEAAIGEYAGARSAVAEMTTAMFSLLFGVLAFQALTPGMISMAPSVADALAHATAISDFPLGRTMGGLWYGVFPPHASAALVGVTIVGLIMIGSVATSFAGVLADPVQRRLGIHRRRLLRLIDALEAEVSGSTIKPFVAREHYYARLVDVWDAAATAFRGLRN